MQAKKVMNMTLDEFNVMDQEEDAKYELINGLVMMSPRPAFEHQNVMTNLLGEMYNFLKGKKCKSIVEAEIEIGEHVLVPDLFIYCEKDKWTKQRYVGGPVLVVEILSPSTAFRDLNTKMRLYEQYGVEEYWVISPKTKVVTVHNFKNETVHEFVVGQFVISDIFEGLEVGVGVLFQSE